MVDHLPYRKPCARFRPDTGAEDTADCVGLFRRSFIMVKQVKVSNFTEVKWNRVSLPPSVITMSACMT